MENKGLLFIPDISGFTKFVSNIELIHSQRIIRELLELLIDENQLGFEISEVEGDAILFYKFGNSPDLSLVYEQVEKMFSAFQKYIHEEHKDCDCKACVTAVDLSLKIITHYGEFTAYKVKNFQKLIGRDVIIAHQLLKNDIDNNEYWLVTQSLMNDDLPKDFRMWMNWHKGAKQTGNDEVRFYYTSLSQLKNELSKVDVE